MVAVGVACAFFNFNTKGKIRYAKKTKKPDIVFFKFELFPWWFSSRLWNIYFRKNTAVICWLPRKVSAMQPIKERCVPDLISSPHTRHASHSNGPLGKHLLLQRVQKVKSVGWFQSRFFISFPGNYDWQLTFSECIVIFLCNPIGQLFV